MIGLQSTGIVERITDVLINNGIAGVVILILFYGIYKVIAPVLKSFLASVKSQTEANMKFAENITALSKEVGQLAITNVAMLQNISKQINDSKEEIISHINNKK